MIDAAEMLAVDGHRATPEETRDQLVEGELIRMFLHRTSIMRTSPAGFLFFHGIPAEKPCGRVFIAPCDVYLSNHDVVQPDVVFVAEANFGSLKEAGVHGAPDLVVEVLSAATAQLDKKAKRRVYARAGVKELWLVDPLLSQIQRYDFAQDTAKPVQLIEENEIFSTPLLPGLDFSAAEIFKR